MPQQKSRRGRALPRTRTAVARLDKITHRFMCGIRNQYHCRRPSLMHLYITPHHGGRSHTVPLAFTE